MKRRMQCILVNQAKIITHKLVSQPEMSHKSHFIEIKQTLII